MTEDKDKKPNKYCNTVEDSSWKKLKKNLDKSAKMSNPNYNPHEDE